ncbi:hypothetical protein B5D77_11835 [Microcystis sp. MC19]|nr:hypothetical protein [Microcystis aeruginosa]AVQ71897.1 hypothetical protein B5D77_11835 [Microcystis sp. MC19]
MSGDRLNLPRMVTQIPEMGTYYSLLGKWGAFFIAIADLVEVLPQVTPLTLSSPSKSGSLTGKI